MGAKLILGEHLEDYFIVQEHHKEESDQTSLHLHCFLKLSKPIKSRSAKLFDINDFHPNIQTVRSVRDVLNYLSKEDPSPLTNIESIKEYTLTKTEEKQAAIIDIINKKRTIQEFIVDYPNYLFQYEKIYKSVSLFQLHQQIAVSTIKVRGIYLRGIPGVGKSYFVREFFGKYGSIYFKPQNKWFDGYTGESVIVLEDLDHQGAVLGHLLKLWLDCYAISGEVKGSYVPLLHKYFVITSNYTLDELFPDKERVRGHESYLEVDNSLLRDAIDRRIQYFSIGDRQDFDYVKTHLDLTNFD